MKRKRRRTPRIIGKEGGSIASKEQGSNAGQEQLSIVSKTRLSIRGEVDHIVSCAMRRDGRVVSLTSLVFFSTDTGDAWMLDPEDGLALRLARDGTRLPTHIDEAADTFAVEWTYDYEFDGEMFVAFEKASGRAITIHGYPVRQIVQACDRALLQLARKAPT
jgi:hypothetical protein